MDYSIHRNVLHEEAVDEMAERSRSNIHLCDQIKQSMRCSGPRLKKCILHKVPIIKWLPRYSIRDNAVGDLVAGVSTGIMHISQGISYALIASIPSVYGLYASFYPVLIYTIFGSSRHVSIGPSSALSVMVRGLTDRLAPDSDFMVWDNETNSSVVDTDSQDERSTQINSAVTILAGIFQIFLGLIHFGVVVSFLSDPLVRGYITAVGFHTILSQLGNIFGIQYVKHSGLVAFIYNLIEVCYVLQQTNIANLLVFIVTFVCLLIAKKLNELLNRKITIPLPLELLAVIISTVISWKFNFKETFDVKVVGKIPSGLQPPTFPPASTFVQVIGDAFAIAVVSFGMSISMAQMFALKFGYKVDSNQELLAMGLCNFIGGTFQSLAVSVSVSRSMVQVNTGGKTQLTGIVSTAVILVVLFWIGVHLTNLPKAVLSAIICVSLKGTVKQLKDIPELWKKDKIDMAIWLVSFILTVLLNPDMGLFASIGFSIVTVVFRSQKPKYSLLGQVKDTDIYRPLEDYDQVKQVPGIVIFRSSATIYFANADMYQDALRKKSGIDVTKILNAKMKLEEKKKKLQKKNKKSKQGDMEPEKDISVIDLDPEPSHTFPRAIILDLSLVSFLDTMAVKALKNIHRDYGKIGIEVILACCQPLVVDRLQRLDFFSDKVTKSCVFSTLHDAVLYCQSPYEREDEVNYCPSIKYTLFSTCNTV
ncbi:solute carrier family 26 member 6-like [Cynoglossus semilaevis]|uniref:solute carrier family 26 member 6-like n=1 Tax=Cynoglossus semilaevis TaxID=244447 RepID=UPI000D626DED|nr:solute carrier family 26 member 6-like [Cynoglossus semilaevis]